MKRICESWINESITGTSSNKNKKESKSNSKSKRNPYKNKVKIECLVCCHQKKNLNFNNVEKNIFQDNDDWEFENQIFTPVNYNLHCLEELDICKKYNLNFFDESNFYNYNKNDIKEVLSFPNINDSFTKLDSNESSKNKNITNKNNAEISNHNDLNYNSDQNNLINLDVIENSLQNQSNNKDFKFNKNSVKVKTLYSNEDISIKYNYILKKII